MPDTAGQGFARGFSRGRDRRLAYDQMEHEKALREAQAILGSISKSREASLSAFEKYVEISKSMVENGVAPDAPEMEQMRRGAQAALMAYGSVLNNLKQTSANSGIDTSGYGDPIQFVDRHMGIFEANLVGAQAAASATPRIKEATAVRDVKGMGEVTVIEQEDLNTGQKNFFVERGNERVEIDSADISGATERTQDVEIEGSTKKALETSVINSGEGLARLYGVQQTFKPEFLTLQGKIKGGWSEFKEKAGLDLATDEQQFLEEFSTFQQTAYDNLNRYIKEITGAQMSEPEAARLSKGIPDPDKDGPTRFEAKMSASLRQLALIRARSMYAIRNGITENPWDEYSLAQIESVIEERHAELRASGFSQEQADAQVRREFGL